MVVPRSAKITWLWNPRTVASQEKRDQPSLLFKLQIQQSRLNLKSVKIQSSNTESIWMHTASRSNDLPQELTFSLSHSFESLICTQTEASFCIIIMWLLVGTINLTQLSLEIKFLWSSEKDENCRMNGRNKRLHLGQRPSL